MMNALHHLLHLNEDRDISLIGEISSLLKRCDTSTHDGHTGGDVSIVDLSSVLFARLLVILFAEVEGCTNKTVSDYQNRSCRASKPKEEEPKKKETDGVDSSKSETSKTQVKPKLPVNGQNEDTKVSSPCRENPPKKSPGGKKSISTPTEYVDSSVSSSSTHNNDSTECTDPTSRIICTGISYLFTEEYDHKYEGTFENNNSNKETLAKIATTFSTFLNSTSKDGPSSKKKDSLEALPKVADIVAFCVCYIENCNGNGVFWCGLCRALIRYRSERNIDYSTITIPQIVQDQLRYIILNSLKFLLHEIKSCCEDYHDFMYIWECFAVKGSILSPLIQPTEIEQSTPLDGNTETKSAEDNHSVKRNLNLAWLLYLTVSLHRSPKSDPDSNNANEKHRSSHILTIASCISLLAFCSSKSKDRKRQFDVQNDSHESSNSKRIKRADGEDQNSAYYSNQIDENERVVSKMNKTTPQHSIVLNPSRPSLEDDAIAALSMMVSAGSGASSGDESPSFGKQQNTPYQEILQILLHSCNQLMSILFSTDHHVPITALSLESEIKKVTAFIIKDYGSKLSPKNETFQKDVNALIKTDHCNESAQNQNKASSISPVSPKRNDACEKLEIEIMSALSSFISSEDDVRTNIKVLSSLYEKVIKYPTRSDCQGFTKLMNFHFLDKYEILENENIRARLIMCIDKKELNKDVTTSQFITYVNFSDYVSTNSRKAQTMNQSKISASSPHSTIQNSLPPNNYKSNTDPKNLTNKSTKSVNHRFPPVRKITESMEINEWTEVILNSFVSSKSIKPSLRLKSYLESADENRMETNSQSKFHTSEITRSLKWQDIMIPILNRTLNRILDYTSRPIFPITNHSSNEFSLFDQSSNTTFSVNEHFHVKHDGEFDLSKCESVFLVSDPQFKITHEVFGAALISLYYISLESILTYETARLKTSSHRKLINSVSFHRGLLSVCHVCLAKATGGVSKGSHDVDHLELFPSIPLAVHSILQKMECSSYEYLKVSEAFVRAFVINCHSMQYNGDRNEFSLGLPSRLVRYVRDIDEIFLDSLLWDSLRNECNEDIRMYTMIKVIEKLKSAGKQGADCKWPPGILHPSLPEEMLDDHRNDQVKASSAEQILATDLYPEYLYITYLLRKFLGITSRRISTLCAALTIPPQYPVATQIWIAFRFLLRNRIELLYDRHVDQLILCTIYSVCKMMKISPDISFAMIIERYTTMNKERLGETICQRITRHVKLNSNENEVSDIDFHSDNLSPQTKNETYGNIISFYNQVYVPAMKEHLLRSKSLKKATSDLKRMLAEHHANEMIKNIHDATTFADHGHLPTNIVRQDSAVRQNWLPSESKRHNNSIPPTRVGNNNFFVKIIPQETNSTSQANRQLGRIKESTAYTGTRILVNLGTPNMKVRLVCFVKLFFLWWYFPDSHLLSFPLIYFELGNFSCERTNQQKNKNTARLIYLDYYKFLDLIECLKNN